MPGGSCDLSLNWQRDSKTLGQVTPGNSSLWDLPARPAQMWALLRPLPQAGDVNLWRDSKNFLRKQSSSDGGFAFKQSQPGQVLSRDSALWHLMMMSLLNRRKVRMCLTVTSPISLSTSASISWGATPQSSRRSVPSPSQRHSAELATRDLCVHCPWIRRTRSYVLKRRMARWFLAKSLASSPAADIHNPVVEVLVSVSFTSNMSSSLVSRETSKVPHIVDQHVALLGIAEVGKHRHDGVVHFRAQVRLSCLLHLGEDHGGNLGGRLLLLLP